jgi:hypothetical protein
MPSSTPPKNASAPDATMIPAVDPVTGKVTLGIPGGKGGTVITARQAGGLIDMKLDVDPNRAGVKPALQHLAKAINVSFQTDVAENELESVYQAAVVLCGEVRIIHREYFGFRDTWFGQFGRFIRSVGLTFQGPDPASPEGQKRFEESGASSIRGLLNLLGRKMDLVTEYEDKVPAYVEQLFDRLESIGIIVGWHREDWDIWTTKVGLDVRIAPKAKADAATS